jgi:hypothetical protein
MSCVDCFCAVVKKITQKGDMLSFLYHHTVSLDISGRPLYINPSPYFSVGFTPCTCSNETIRRLRACLGHGHVNGPI